MTRSRATVAGLQQCLALEHEAVWVYAYLGARMPAADTAAHKAFGSHRRSRDTLIAMLRASGAIRPGPLTDYAVDVVENLGQAQSVARAIEDKGARAYLSLVGVSEGKDRRFAIESLRKAALATLHWAGKPSAFPGLPH